MTSEKPFVLIEPESEAKPFLLSIPHCGIDFPKDVAERMDAELTRAPDDTDWHLDRLYDFAPGLGATVIHARYSRWVIDLNREPGGKPLYDDGRIITELCPTTDFTGKPLYMNSGDEPDDAEKERRLAAYFQPYHDEIDSQLAKLKDRYPNVIFWDGHSIRRRVESIRPEPFPDMILGDNDARSASPSVIEAALEALASGSYGVNHNHPFKGGFLTRSKGDPDNGVHALQLEMTKDLYMDSTETEYDEKKAGVLKNHLRSVFERLIGMLAE
ncbi:MAG: N-formylglutamate deformylase [Acidobacteria bacterium]|nr:MAG: N-formylglutamate deformylase [Acidobacteriota bacterium]REJ98882.1 MAG: N-formylglutamate deformylase [Acidobacteriota bacterium]REK16398.1 MAG: N-formylglutamate deformylase [Acidobacteriota bacterium]REK44079.1 MAG: N-formylglutamate deformylase [Acidobacteriota bacterium]